MAKSRRTRRKKDRPTDVEPRRSIPEIPGWLPPVLFGVLTLWLFRAFVFSDQMLVGNDTLSLGYVARAFYAQALTEMGTFPLWAPRILGGTPFLDALSGGDSLYPPSLALLLVMEPHRALGWKLVLHIFLAGLFMFGWVRTLGVSRAAALVAGTGFMLAPMLVSLVHPGHDGKIFVTALAPLLFWAVERFFTRPGLAPFAGVGLTVALVISTTHFQMAYFLFGAVGLYAIFRAVQVARGTDQPAAARARTNREDDAPGDDAAGSSGSALRWKPATLRFGLFLAASVAGAAGASVQLLPAVEYVTEHSRRTQTTGEAAGERGVDWSSSWSIHPEEAMSLVIPEFAGNVAGGSDWASGTYWGRNFLKDNHEYAGLIVLLLATVAFAGGARVGVRRFFLGLGAVAFLFALGANTPVWRVFYEVVPGIRLFRAPSQAMFLFAFGAATLAAFGIDRIFRAVQEDDEASWDPVLKVLWIGGGVLAALAFLASTGVLTSVWTAVVYSDVDAGRLQRLEALRPFLVRGAFLAAVFGIAAATATWALRRRWLPPAGFLAVVLLLVVVDEARIDGTFIQTMDFYEWAQPDGNIRTLQEREAGSDEPYRLLSLARQGQDVKPSLYGIELAAGHHPNDLGRYRELIGMVGSGFPENLLQANIRRLLNVRYILWPDAEIGAAPQGPVVSRLEYPDGRAYQTLLAADGLDRARLVADVVVRSDEEAVPYMLSGSFDPTSQVVLAEEPPVELGGGPVTGDVTWVDRRPNRLELRVQSDRPALLTVADNWFPAWEATVDGEAAPVLRAYHTLRAVPVPAGESTVVMEYRSALLARTALWSTLVLLGLVATGAVGLMLRSGRAPRGGAGEGSSDAAGGVS